jgi:hypothetical protein
MSLLYSMKGAEGGYAKGSKLSGHNLDSARSNLAKARAVKAAYVAARRASGGAYVGGRRNHQAMSEDEEDMDGGYAKGVPLSGHNLEVARGAVMSPLAAAGRAKYHKAISMLRAMGERKPGVAYRHLKIQHGSVDGVLAALAHHGGSGS